MTDEAIAKGQCNATLRHTHDTGHCWLDSGHGGAHRTPCEPCEANDEFDVWLSWEGEGKTIWPI